MIRSHSLIDLGQLLLLHASNGVQGRFCHQKSVVVRTQIKSNVLKERQLLQSSTPQATHGRVAHISPRHSSFEAYVRSQDVFPCSVGIDIMLREQVDFFETNGGMWCPSTQQGAISFCVRRIFFAGIRCMILGDQNINRVL
jgi:hypothetical protein